MMNEEERLALSGLQHLAFCERQWALIHLEQAWADNERTAQGSALHERAHDIALREKRGETLIVRAQPLYSDRLGLYGVADVVEYQRDDAGVSLQGRAGRWLPVPVEYKRGSPKREPVDDVQVCAQAMCLEEMMGIFIGEAYLFYHETRSRESVMLDAALREHTETLARRMHEMYRAGVTPPPCENRRACRACSLRSLCAPETFRLPPVSAYMDDVMRQLEESP